MRYREIETKLADALRLLGIEKVICPFLGGLVHRSVRFIIAFIAAHHSLLGRLSEDKSSTILESLISNSNTPSVIISAVTILLISLAINSETPAAQVTTARVLLSLINQRYPAILKNASKQIVEGDDNEEDEEEVKEKIEQLTISLSIVSRVQFIRFTGAKQLFNLRDLDILDAYIHSFERPFSRFENT